MNFSQRIYAVTLLVGFIPVCCAFETETHALITRKAFDESVLNSAAPGSVINRLLLDRLNPTAPFNIYWTPPGFFEEYYTTGTQEGVTVGSGTWLMPSNALPPQPDEQCQMQEFTSIPRPISGADTRQEFRSLFGDTSDPSGSVLPIQNWLVRGAIREDDLGKWTTIFPGNCWWSNYLSTWGDLTRVYNHFYDPAYDKGMPLCPSGSTCERTTAWALGNIDATGLPTQEDTSRENHYSYRDAHNLMWAALTREFNNSAGQAYSALARQADSVDRMYLWATTFRALGDVLHLLEDMGQPQHTRNDPHSPVVTSLEQQAFEGYTNARVLGGTTSDANAYVRGFFASSSSLTAPPIDGYPIVVFSTPLEFFTSSGASYDTGIPSRMGLADYTNRGFFTGGTLPPDTEYGTQHSYPPLAFTDSAGNPINGYSTVGQSCPSLQESDPRLSSVVCRHYLHTVPDNVLANSPGTSFQDTLPAGYSLPNVPLATDSIFEYTIAKGPDAGLTTYISGYAISPVELDTIGNLTIPRAVGYAAGMINYFFRGTLQVSAPASGIYAIVNHGTPHKVGSDGVPYLVSNPNQVFGFTQVRLQVQNTTPPINDPGYSEPVSQTAGGSGAVMVAIARYHRNPCYQPDLSGDPSIDSAGNPHQPNCPSFRAPYPEISVSAEVPVSLGMLDGQPIEQQFDFTNDPIPINATDVFIQVAYRGQLGDETDGIAVGSIDVSEPSYENNLAMTDIPLQYQEDGSTWKWEAWTSPPWSSWIWPVDGRTITHAEPDPVADLALTHVEICDDGFQIYTSTSTEQLPEDHVVRIAVLRDFTSHTIKSQDTFQGQFASPSAVGTYTRSGGDINQAQNERGDGNFTTYRFYGRGFVNGDTKSYSFIGTCIAPYPSTCPTVPQDPPSPWDATAALPDITPPAAGFISENIGQVILPITSGGNQTAACTIQGDYQSY